MNEDTIVAIATGRMMAAISIIRLSGPYVFDVMKHIFKKDLSKVQSHTIHYGYIHDGDELIDEVLVNVYHGKRTFTGENMVEINCHGGLFITNRVLEVCLKYGARLARNGEFSERAFLNGRIDLAQAESISELIEANTVQSSKMALSGIRGSISKLIEDLNEKLIQIITHIEVNIDYPEYLDIEELTSNTLLPLTSDFMKDLDHIIKNARSGQILKDGIKTAIVGRPNVGKSSLLNALIEEEKAIVTNIAGTTRDIVEGVVNINGIKLNLIDTAGIHETDDIVEKIGVDKSIQAISDAELILFVVDASEKMTSEDWTLYDQTRNKQCIVVLNKCDLGKVCELDGIEISASNHEVQSLIDEVEKRFALDELQASQEVLISNSRQIALLLKARDYIQSAVDAMNMQIPTDLIVVDLYDAWKSLKEILGQEAKEDFLDELFSRFCIGK